MSRRSSAASSSESVRVLVVDDSPFMRRAIERLLRNDPRISVIGMAGDGVEAVEQNLRLRPDVITMDVQMPRLDGLSAVREIMCALPTPIVMLSTATQRGAAASLQALEAGALEVVAKPGPLSGDLEAAGAELCAAVIRASQVPSRRVAALAPPSVPAFRSVTADTARHLVVIGSSTGGPPALTRIISGLGARLDAAVLIVQHMPTGFTAALAQRLDAISSWHVSEARAGDSIRARTVLVAPGGSDLQVTRDRSVRLDAAIGGQGVSPSIDRALASAAEVFREEVTAVILTGIGRDGADGCAAVDAAGGRVVVQDRATSVVYGMPRAARESCGRATEAPIDGIPVAIARSVTARALGDGRRIRE